MMEIGKRRIRDRIRAFETQVESLSKQQDLRRKRRREEGIPVLSIVGYTNTGRSTMLDAMTGGTVGAAAKRFMTLDLTSRRLRFPFEGEVVIADLPPDLVAASRATLEELEDAHLLQHVVGDFDSPIEQTFEAVGKILAELDFAEIPRLVVFNKANLLPEHERVALCRRFRPILISAIRHQGFAELIHAAEARLGVEEQLTQGPALQSAKGEEPVTPRPPKRIAPRTQHTECQEIGASPSLPARNSQAAIPRVRPLNLDVLLSAGWPLTDS